MGKMLKSDLRMISKSKAMFVGPIVVLAMMFISVLTLNLVMKNLEGVEIPQEIQGSLLITAKDVIFSALSMADIRLMVIIMAGIFIGGDFAHGTIKNSVMTGESRTKIYLSKIMTLSVFAVGLYVFSVIIASILGYAFLGGPVFTGAEFGLFMRSFFLSVFIVVGYACFYGMLASLIRTTGGSIGAGIVFYLVLALGVSLIEVLANTSTEAVSTYFLYGLEIYSGSYGAFTTAMSLKSAFVPLVYIGISTGVGIYAFTKRDIK